MTFALKDFAITLPLEMRRAPGAGGIVEGYASVFDEPDVYGDRIAPGAFAKTLEDHRREGTAPAMLWGHDQRSPIGRWTALHEDSKGLFAKGELNLKSDLGREAHAHLQGGDIDGLSIGFLVPKGGRLFDEDGASIINAVELMEISVVACPANRRARVTSVKSIRDLEDVLHRGGLPHRAARKFAAHGWHGVAGGRDPERDLKLTSLAMRVQAVAEALKVK